MYSTKHQTGVHYLYTNKIRYTSLQKKGRAFIVYGTEYSTRVRHTREQRYKPRYKVLNYLGHPLALTVL